MSNDQNIYRWDRAAHKFVVDNRLQLPLDVPKRLHSSMRLRTGAYGLSWCPPMRAVLRALPAIPMEASISMKTPTGPSRATRIHPRLSIPMGASGPRASRCSDLTRGCVRRCRPVAGACSPGQRGSTLVYGGAEVPDGSELRLPAGSSSVRFQFAAPVYSDSADIDYQYLLEGADKDWSAWGKQKEANYSGLGPGNYRFRVRARSDDGRVSPEGTYAFTILPPWYRTTLAYVLYGLLFLLLAVAGWRLHQHV